MLHVKIHDTQTPTAISTLEEQKMSLKYYQNQLTFLTPSVKNWSQISKELFTMITYVSTYLYMYSSHILSNIQNIQNVSMCLPSKREKKNIPDAPSIMNHNHLCCRRVSLFLSSHTLSPSSLLIYFCQ